MQENKYDETISQSKEESLRKALKILEEENKENVEKTISRPVVNTGRILMAFLGWLFFFIALSSIVFVVCFYLDVNLWIAGSVVGGIAVMLIAFKAKSVICNMILLYQKYAPEKLRKSCLFTPSCSEYMLQAVNKYGVVKGLLKGISRLARCHHPNGGTDYP